MKQYEVAYGKNNALICELPDSWQVETIRRTYPEIGRDQVREIITHPIGSKTIRELAAGAKKVAIILEDHTRFTPLVDAVDVLLEELEAAGVQLENALIVGACATHRITTRADIARKISPAALEKLRVVEHNVLDASAMTQIGTTSRGNAIFINSEVAACDLIIGVGGMAPHGSVRFGGGAKLLLPGVSGFDTILFNHTRIEQKVSFGGNAIRPMRQDMEEAAQMVNYAFNISGFIDHDGKLVNMVAGDPIVAHRAGMKIGEELYYASAEDKADLVIACSNPLDVDCFQAVKGLLPAVEFVKPGGTILWVSECGEGIGTHLLTQKNPVYNQAMIRGMQDRCSVARVIFHSGNLAAKDLYEFIAPEIEFYSDWDEAVKAAVSGAPENAKVKILWASPFTVGV